MKKVRINWNQAVRANDRKARLHRCLRDQPKGCKFNEMKNFQDFTTIVGSQNEAKSRGVSLKKCIHCFKG